MNACNDTEHRSLINVLMIAVVSFEQGITALNQIIIWQGKLPCGQDTATTHD